MKKDTKWEDIGFVLSSSYRTKILEKLNDPRMPSLLSRELDINKTHVSRALKELTFRKVIECKNPKVNKGRIYVATDYGKAILKEVKKTYGSK